MKRIDDLDQHRAVATDDDDLDLATRLLRAAGELETPPPDLEARARAVVEARWRARVAAARPRRGPWMRLALPLAAGLAVTAAVVLWWGRSGSDEGTTAERMVATAALVRGDVVSTAGKDAADGRPLAVGARLAATSRIVTGTGALAALALDDSTSLRLASETSVVLRAAGRVELERGSIYVDRRHDPDEERRDPIEVITAFGVVHDLGTQFELAVSGDTMTTRVREGEVAVIAEGERHIASAGAELEWSASRGVVRREIASNAAAWSWVIEAAPAVDLEGWTLEQTMAWMARETGSVVTFADPALAARIGSERIDGELKLQPGQALEIVPRLFGLTLRTEPGAIVLETANE
jgi:hypothetical protein